MSDSERERERTGPIRVVIVDDHAVVRSGLEQFLATSGDFEVVGTAADGNEAIACVAEQRPDVVLMDLSMPELDGIEATRRISEEYPSSRVLVLTSFSDQTRIMDSLGAGADGYLLKHSDPDDIAKAIRAVHGGGSPLDPKAARALLESRRARATGPQLTDREREVLLLVRDGLANKQIARRLGIAERTVKAHLTSVFQRLGVADRTQAALWASEHLAPSDFGTAD
jgi:DNA-binding NarL/FixJ family response regulator